jgi:hypothetical protein
MAVEQKQQLEWSDSTDRRGTNLLNNEVMKDGEYDAKAFSTFINEEVTTQDVDAIAERQRLGYKMVQFHNVNATSEHYKYPVAAVFGTDRTQDPPRSMDALYVDEDVIAYLEVAYPDVRPLSNLDDAVLAKWFTSVARGKDVLGAL